jgi:hypothetical protein
MPADATDTPIHTDARATAIRVNCPHCEHPIDVIPINAVPPSSAPASPLAPPAVRAARTVLVGLIHRLVPVSNPVGSAIGTSPPPDQAISSGSRRWMLLGVVLLMAAVVVALIVWGRPGATNASPVGSVPVTTAAVNRADIAAQEAAIRETLMSYNAAETEAAALLRIDPLTPYLAPEGPFAERRAAELAERQRRNAPHRSILVRWGIGQISIAGTTATVVTQETWSNQEASAVAPEQATVRVTYTLRWEDSAGRWLIVESEQVAL